MAAEDPWFDKAVQCSNYFYCLWDDENYYLAKIIGFEGEAPNRNFRLHFYHYGKSADRDVEESYLLRPNNALEYNDESYSKIKALNKRRTAFQLGYRHGSNGNLFQIVRNSDDATLVPSPSPPATDETVPRRRRGRPKGAKRVQFVESPAPPSPPPDAEVEKPVVRVELEKPTRPKMILPKLSEKRQSEILHAHLRPSARP